MRKFNITTFKKWIIDSGAEIMTVTNEWEILRFRCENGIGIIYKNKKGILAFCGSAEEARKAFVDRKNWNAVKKESRTKLSVEKRTILKRDGEQCFYCLMPLESDITIEHLFSLSQGGTNHISNLVLAHKQCNEDAGNLSLIEKISRREQALMEMMKGVQS